MSDYPHRLRVSRGGVAAGGAQDDDGVWVDNPALDNDETVYDDLADVQDGGRELERDNFGRPDVQSDAIAFLRKEAKVKDIKVGDTATITWEDGVIDTATVNKVRRLDGTIFLKYL